MDIILTDEELGPLLADQVDLAVSEAWAVAGQYRAMAEVLKEAAYLRGNWAMLDEFDDRLNLDRTDIVAAIHWLEEAGLLEMDPDRPAWRLPVAT